MSYTETTYKSWFTRIKEALIKIVVGLILIVGTTILLFWNEGRAINTYRALVEGAGLVVDVDSAAPDQANEGKLVHISGPVVPGGLVEDSEFGIVADGAVGLNRSVEMYQWVEKQESHTDKQLGGGEETTTTYTYSKEWSDRPVDSSRFKKPDGHENPEMPISSQNFEVSDAKVGGFTIRGEDIAPLGEASPVRMTEENIDAFNAYFGDSRPVKLSQGGIYAGSNPSSPSVGDLRITYSRGDLKEASFVGKQNGEGLGPYTASNGHDIFLSAAGKVPAAQMFKDAEDLNVIITWLIRAGGLLLMFFGFAMTFSILSVLADIVPLIGSIVAFGTGTLALVLTLLWGPFVIAIGWFAYRPLLALAILAGGALLAGLFWYLRKGRAAAPAAAAPQTLGRPQA
ncbi:TMEM43 family protein [Gellertiella hungarica]|uniref:Uncharacterized protein n=1 Tax=Gellertiella hungarica TaxID=1572859 RepID=A0A7W6J6U5_9HYPH|nr:TMEM43 family protein [Gellertiella hungarica]MBB4065876.1 hypothetical protein [Gellertiella hungarica]